MTYETHTSAIDDLQNNVSLWDYEPGAGETTNFPSKYNTRFGRMHDQMADPFTHYACTIFGMVHTDHSTENREHLDPVAKSKEAVAYGFDKTRGRSLGGVSEFARKTIESVKGYYRVKKEITIVKAALMRGALISGSRLINRGKTRRNSGFAVFGGGAGHMFSIDGWNDDMEHGGKKGFFVCLNSSSSLPEFYVAYEDISKLYTFVFLEIDESKVVKTKQTQDERAIAYAVEQGITNGENLDRKAFRSQCAVMLGRMLFGDNTYEAHGEMTRAMGIWNGEDGHLLRIHAWIMIGRYILREHNIKGIPDAKLIEILTRVGITNGNRADEVCTRRELIIMLARMHQQQHGNI